MKKILNAIDGNSKVEAVESSDMKKFLSVVVEGKNTSTNRLSMAEQMAVQQYTPTASKPITNPVLNVSKDAKPSMIGKYFKQIEEEIEESQDRSKQRAKLIAELAINKMQNKSKKKISKDMAEGDANKDTNSTVQKVVTKVSNTLSNALPKSMRPFDNDTAADTVAKYKKPQTKEGMAENIIALTSMRNKLDEKIKELAENYMVPTTDSKSPIPGKHVSGCQCKEVEEGLKDPKDNPCWKGYKPVGTKKKGGRTVPNCVPKESISEDYPPINVPKGWEAKPQPDGSIRISKIGSMSSAEYKQNMANYKDQNWTPEKIAQHQARTASGQGYTDAEKAANYQQQQKQFGKYADQPLEGVAEGAEQKFNMKLAKILKQRGYKGPVKLEQLGMKWVEAIGNIVDLDDYIMVQGNDPEYDGWVSYVFGLGEYAYGAEMGYTTGAAKKVEVDTRDEKNVGEGSTPKGYDSDGNPLGGGYDEYENNWVVTVDGKSWKTFDDEKQAYKAAAAIERKYGKKTRVYKN